MDSPRHNSAINRSDFALILIPEFTHGRAGRVGASAGGSASDAGVSGTAAGLRKRTLSLVQGRVVRPSNASGLLPHTYLGVSLQGLSQASAPDAVVLSTDRTLSVAEVVNRTELYRSREAATLAKYGEEWSPVKDAVQSVLMWSFIYDNREGLVAPEFPDGAFQHKRRRRREERAFLLGRILRVLYVVAGWPGLGVLELDPDHQDANCCWLHRVAKLGHVQIV